MISLLVVDGAGQLTGHLQQGGVPIEGIEVIGVKDPAEAIGVLENRDIDALAVDGRSVDLDPLGVTTWVLRFKPELKLVFVTDEPTPAPSSIISHSHGPIFINIDDIRSRLGSIFGQNGGTGGRRPTTAVDVLDVSRIAGLQRSNGAVQVFADRSTGTLRFEDGILVHAACGSIVGSDAFFSMMLWPRGDIQRLSDEEAEACETNVWFPSAFLFQEAERFRSVLRGEKDSPEERPADTGDSEADCDVVWKELAKTYPAGVRVVIACSNRCEGSCFRKSLTELVDALGSAPPWLSESSDGPSFARVHPGSGGTLALTRIPLTRRHEYLFETLSKSAEVTLLCGTESCDRVGGVELRSSTSIVSTIGGEEMAFEDLRRVLRQLADGGRGQ